MSDIINLDIVIRQGAEYREQYKRITTQYLFEAATSGTSGSSAPTWPTTIDSTVTDNTITWMNKGVYSNEYGNTDVDVWLASTAYARRAKVITPIASFDLTDYTGAFQIRSTVDATTTIHAGTVTFGTRTDGLFSMVIATADTTDFDFDTAVYDLELSTPTGEVDLVLRGTATLIKEVTR